MPVAVRAWVEAIGWGGVAGAGYGLLLLGGLMVLSLPGATPDANDWTSITAFGVYGAYLALVWGGLLGGAYGVVAGVPIAVAMSALSALLAPERVVLQRVLGALSALMAVVATGVGLGLGVDRNLTGMGYRTTGPGAPSTALWIAVFAVVPGVIAATIFAWRTPSIARRGRTAERPLFAPAENREAAVARLAE